MDSNPGGRASLKTLYAALAVVGYVGTNWLVLLVSLDTGNILLWTKPAETTAGMFANRIAAAFAVDLFLTVLVACIWFHVEGKRLQMRRVWGYWVLTFTFGLAGTFPLFLLHRQRRLEQLENTQRGA